MAKKKTTRKRTKKKNTTNKNPATAKNIPTGPLAKLPDLFHITTVEQLSALASSKRQKILAEFKDQARTTKQVAIRLGEPPTRLYHHVDELVKHGFLVLERESPKRGTTEKYYRAAARQFRVDERCLSEPGFIDENSRVLNELLDEARAKIMKSLADAADGEPLLTTTASGLVTASDASIEKVSQAFVDQLDRFASKPPAAKKSDLKNRYRIVVLIFPDDE